jgi:hypothetical protein
MLQKEFRLKLPHWSKPTPLNLETQQDQQNRARAPRSAAVAVGAEEVGGVALQRSLLRS